MVELSLAQPMTLLESYDEEACLRFDDEMSWWCVIITIQLASPTLVSEEFAQ